MSPSPEAPYFPTTSGHPSMQYSGHPQDHMWPQQSPQMQQAYAQQRGMPGYTMPNDGGRYAYSDDLIVCVVDASIGLTPAHCPTPRLMDTTRAGILSMAKVSLYLTAEATRHSRIPHRQRMGSITLAPPDITLTPRPTPGASLQRYQCKSFGDPALYYTQRWSGTANALRGTRVCATQVTSALALLAVLDGLFH